MKPIYRNFDGLEISFQGALPERILRQLREAKEEAVKDRNDTPALIGNNIQAMVAETGSKGGYAFRFDTGIDGATWFIADSLQRNRWNIRVSVKSLALALHGYIGVKQKILEVLENLDARGEDNGIPLERVSRFDYCIDFAAIDPFELDHKCVIAHSRAIRDFDGLRVNFVAQGKRFSSLRVGVMPNKQVAIYNKTSEIIARKKSYWWQLWGLEKEKYSGEVWRVEARAGKKELDQWNLKRFADFEKMAGDVIRSIFDHIRYVKPNLNDSNQQRWPDADFWVVARKEIEKDLFQHISNAKREMVVSAMRKEKEIQYKKLISGIITSYTAVTGKDIAELPAVIDLISEDLENEAKLNPEKILKKFQKAEKKFQYCF